MNEAITLIEQFFASRLGETITRGLLDAFLNEIDGKVVATAAKAPVAADEPPVKAAKAPVAADEPPVKAAKGK